MQPALLPPHGHCPPSPSRCGRHINIAPYVSATISTTIYKILAIRQKPSVSVFPSPNENQVNLSVTLRPRKRRWRRSLHECRTREIGDAHDTTTGIWNLGWMARRLHFTSISICHAICGTIGCLWVRYVAQYITGNLDNVCVNLNLKQPKHIEELSFMMFFYP